MSNNRLKFSLEINNETNARDYIVTDRTTGIQAGSSTGFRHSYNTLLSMMQAIEQDNPLTQVEKDFYLIKSRELDEANLLQDYQDKILKEIFGPMNTKTEEPINCVTFLPSQNNISLKDSLHIPAEFSDVVQVMEMGSKKHGVNSWLEPGVFDFGQRLGSIFRHLIKLSNLQTYRTQWNQGKIFSTQDLDVVHALNLIETLLIESKYSESTLLDEESNLSHFLHIQCNAAMFHTLISRRIITEEQESLDYDDWE